MDAAVTLGLVLSPTPLSLILTGRKQWEMRTRNRPGAVGKTIALIAKGTNTVWGFATVTACALVPWSDIPADDTVHTESGCTGSNLRQYGQKEGVPSPGLWALHLDRVRALATPSPLPEQLRKRCQSWDNFGRANYEIPAAVVASATAELSDDAAACLHKIASAGGVDLPLFKNAAP